MRFVIYVDDHSLPHIHVAGPGDAKIALDGRQTILADKGLSKADIARARDVVKRHRNVLLDAWMDIHGRID